MKKIWSMMVAALAVVSSVSLACAAETAKPAGEPAGSVMEEKKMDDKKMETMKPDKKVKKAKKPQKEVKDGTKGDMKGDMKK